VALDLEAHANPFVAVSDLVREPQDSAQIDVALDLRLDRGELHAAGGGDVRESSRQVDCFSPSFMLLGPTRV